MKKIYIYVQETCERRLLGAELQAPAAAVRRKESKGVLEKIQIF